MFVTVDVTVNNADGVCWWMIAVVVLCASPDSVREIMIKAHELNFDNGEYVFVNIDLFSRCVLHIV